MDVHRYTYNQVNYIITNMITLTQTTKAETFSFKAVLVVKLLSCNVLFINKTGIRNF